MSQVSGKNQKVRYGSATILKTAKFQVLDKIGKHDITSGESLGKGTWAAGVEDVDFTLEGVMDIGATNFTDLVRGVNTGLNLKLYLNSPDPNALTGPFWLFPDVFIEEYEMTPEVRGTINIRIKGSNQGAFTVPTGV